MESKVVISQNDSYGTIIESPDFNKDIKVTFALDIPARTRIELQELADKIENEADLKIKKELNDKFAEYVILALVRDWNIYESDSKKLVISAESLEKKMSSRLLSWITNTAFSFLAQMTQISKS